MPPMPFVVTQGYVNTALENAWNEGAGGRSAIQTRLDTLHDLRSGVDVGRSGRILSQVISDHINEHWFGHASPAGQPTGWWINWEGPAEEIARHGMSTALEASLGLPRDIGAAEIDELRKQADWQPEQCLLLNVEWICPVPRFEFWVSWRTWSELDLGQWDGVALITMATPGLGDYEPPPDVDAAVLPPYTPMKTVLDPPWAATTYPANGHVVVGAHTTSVSEMAVPLDPGLELANSWQMIVSSRVTATGGVVTFAPGPVDGIDDTGSVPPGIT